MGIKDFNKVILIGRNVQDPEIKYIGENKTPLVRIRIAVDKSYKDKNGEWVNQADFPAIEVWGKSAEFIQNNLLKGDMVRVQGKLTSKEWETQEGQKRTDWFIKPDFGFEGIQIVEKKKAVQAEVMDDQALNFNAGSNSEVPF